MPTERIAALAALSQKISMIPPSVAVEYDPMDMALPEPILNAKRITEYIRAQTVYLTESNRFTGMLRFSGQDEVPADLFHRIGHRNFAKACGAFYNKHRDNLVCFEWQHSTPNYERILQTGIEECLRQIAYAKTQYPYDREKQEFLSGMEIICNGVTDWADKCADAHFAAAESCKDEKRRAELLRLAEACRRVPRHPAETFYEGLHGLIFCFQFLPDSIGTIDRFLQALYEQDIANGTLTREEAKELLQEVFIYISNHTPPKDGNADRSAECHFAIGGYNEFGQDSFSDLSRLIVEALMDIDTRRPEISLRWTEKLPYETLKWMLDCERKDKNKRIAFVNDEPRIRAFMKNVGVSYGEAVRYTMVGCNEPSFQGSVWFGGCTANIARSLTNTLQNRRAEICKCTDFEQFYAIYCEELAKDVDEILRYADAFNDMRAKDIHMLSCFLLDGCIESGRSATQGGCKTKIGGSNLMGITCVIDSLSIIKQYVFEEKKTDFAHLLAVLESDWAADETLRKDILKNGRFFGNNDPLSNEMARRLTGELYRLTHDHRMKNGAHILFGTLAGYHPHYAAFGRTTAATPDGRYAGEAFMVGVGQNNGKDREGLPALLQSVAQMDPNGILCGPLVCNVMIDKTAIVRDDYFEKVCRMIEAYFKLGGLHIQLNYVSKADLLAAQKTPEQYESLKVRVSGFSASFTGLCTDIQEEIIHRTEKK